MSAHTGEHPASNGRVRRISPEEVRRHQFTRTTLSRRGLDDEEVMDFLAAVADQLVAMETEIEQVGDENRRLKHAMREWHRQQVGYDSTELVARTQQEIEEQIARAEAYSREREEEAARRYEAIVAEAYQRAEEAVAAEPRHISDAAQADGHGNGTASHLRSEEPTAVPQRSAEDAGVGPAARLQVEGLLRALEGLSAHIDAARSLFAQKTGVADDPLGDEEDGSQGSLFTLDAEGRQAPEPINESVPALAVPDEVGRTEEMPVQWSDDAEFDEVDPHGGFEARRDVVPGPPARPAPFTPTAAPPENGPDAPG